MVKKNSKVTVSANSGNDLIKVTENNGKKVVSARELHEFLGLNERFSKWFDRFIDYGFEDGVDYTPYQMVHPLNNQEVTDYAITIDMAKELSMLQRTDKGKQARRYFIECERKTIKSLMSVPKNTILRYKGYPISVNEYGYWNVNDMCIIFNKKFHSWNKDNMGFSAISNLYNIKEPKQQVIYDDSFGKWMNPCALPMFSAWLNSRFSIFCNMFYNTAYSELSNSILISFESEWKMKSIHGYLLSLNSEPTTEYMLYENYMRYDDGIPFSECYSKPEFVRYIRSMEWDRKYIDGKSMMVAIESGHNGMVLLS